MSSEAMPTVAAWVDSMRAAFGRDGVDASIRRGLRDDCEPQARFFATEAGKTIGQRDGFAPERSCSADAWLQSSAMMGGGK